MKPVLFTIGEFRVETYYVIWAVALFLALKWALSRVQSRGLPEWESRSVIFWAFLGLILGAQFIGYIPRWRFFASNPSLLLDPNYGSLSETGGFLGAFILGLFMCKRRGVSFWALADVGAPPALLALAIGRWGCFFNGCCEGIVTSSPLGLRFPFDPIYARHPTQLYHAFSALVLLLLLMGVEFYFRKRKIYFKYGILPPLVLIGHYASRFFINPLRVSRGESSMGTWIMCLAFGLGVIWLIAAWKTRRQMEILKDDQIL
jgi:phosphatidylglycerol:prolipoprotein diacylglycerol transferase